MTQLFSLIYNWRNSQFSQIFFLSINHSIGYSLIAEPTHSFFHPLKSLLTQSRKQNQSHASALYLNPHGVSFHSLKVTMPSDCVLGRLEQLKSQDFFLFSSMFFLLSLIFYLRVVAVFTSIVVIKIIVSFIYVCKQILFVASHSFFSCILETSYS